MKNTRTAFRRKNIQATALSAYLTPDFVILAKSISPKRVALQYGNAHESHYDEILRLLSAQTEYILATLLE